MSHRTITLAAAAVTLGGALGFALWPEPTVTTTPQEVSSVTGLPAHHGYLVEPVWIGETPHSDCSVSPDREVTCPDGMTFVSTEVVGIGDVTGPDGAVHRACVAWTRPGSSVLSCPDGFTDES